MLYLLFLSEAFQLLFYLNNGVCAQETRDSTSVLLKNTDILIENFFANLEQDVLNKNSLLSEEATKKYVRNKVDDFLEMLNVKNVQKHRFKRSIKEDNLAGKAELTLFKNLPSNNAKEVVFFQNNKIWYAAVIESGQLDQQFKKTDLFTIYRYYGYDFHIIQQIRIYNGQKITTYPFKNTTLIVIAEYDNKMHVYRFMNENLYIMQTLGIKYATDAILWGINNDIYLAVAQEKLDVINNNNKAMVNYEITSPIYKWVDTFFNPLCNISTSGAKKLTHFSAEGHHYLIVANYQDNRGNTNIFSEIYKFDFVKNTYVLHQRLKTFGAVDVKTFCFTIEGEKHHFLAVANSYDSNASSKNVESFVYKFTNGYFIPFQNFEVEGGIIEFLPVFGQHFEFALLALTKELGLNSYTFNGWDFIEHQSTFLENITATSMNFYYFNYKPILAITRTKSVDIFIVNFTLDKESSLYYYDEEDELLEWCETALSTIQKNSKQNQNLLKSESLINSLANDKEKILRSRMRESEHENENNNPFIQKLETISNKLENLNNELSTISEEFNFYLTTDKMPTFEGEIQAEEVILNNNCQVKNIISGSVNKINIFNFLANILSIHDGFSLEENLGLILEDFTAASTIKINMLNGHPFNSLLNKDIKNLSTSNLTLTVKGNVTFKENVQTEFLNNTKFDSENVLLVKGDQTFKQSFKFHNLIADKVVAFNNLPKIVNKNITVDDLTINGRINGIDVANLLENTLKIGAQEEQQIITGKYTFNEELTVNDINLTINNFVLIDNDEDDLALASVNFTTEPLIKKLVVQKYLNDIKVLENGMKLDVLLKNSDEMQFIDGTKTFENNVQLLNQIMLHGKIKNNDVEERNPVQIIEQEVQINGDFVVNGSVTIEKLLKIDEEIKTGDLKSLKQIQEFGLKLTETEIPVQMRFLQELSVDELSVKKINGINTNSWINSEQPKKITGTKIFNGDVYVTGKTIINSVNDINLFDLQNNTLFVNRDQEITGKITFKEANLQNSLFNTKSSQEELILQDVAIKQLNVNQLIVHGKTNKLNASELLSDIVLEDDNSLITNKKFHNLSVKSLKADNVALLRKQQLNELTIEEDLEILNRINIKKIKTSGTINNENIMARSRGDVAEDEDYEKVIILGNCIIKSGRLNHILIKEELIENTVKIDEPFEFNSAKFNKILAKFIDLKGHIEKVDVNSLITKNKLEQQIFEDMTFTKDVKVKGNLKIAGLVNDYNLTSLCDYLHPNLNSPITNLFINGSADFKKQGIDVKFANGFDIKKLVKNGWHGGKDLNINIKENLKFNNVFFKENITIKKNSINEVDIVYLKNNVFTLSTNQRILANCELKNAQFSNGLVTNKANVNKHLNDIDLNKFVSSALINNTYQIFENPIYINDIKVEKIKGDFTLNGMDFNNDILRIDHENVFTGIVKVKNLTVKNLLIKRDGVKLQEVDVRKWMENALLNKGQFNLNNKAIFNNNVTFKHGFKTNSLVNNIKFDKENIMLAKTPQNVTGKKVFKNSKMHNSIIKKIHFDGKLNGVDFDELSKNLVNISSSSNTAVINSETRFNKKIFANNVNFAKTFNGVNLTNLLNRLEKSSLIDDYLYRYENLNKILQKVYYLNENQAYFLRYFKEVQYFYENYIYMFPITLNGCTKLVAVCLSGQEFIIKFFKWDYEYEKFSLDEGIGWIAYEVKITYIAALEFNQDTYLLVENYHPSDYVNTHYVQILKLIEHPINSYKPFGSYANNETVLIKSFKLEEKNCYLSIEGPEFNGNIYCNIHYGPFALKQKLYKTMKDVSIVENKNGCVFIFSIIDNHDPQVVIYKHNAIIDTFEIVDYINVQEPKGIITIQENEFIYIAVFTGNNDASVIHILRYDLMKMRMYDYQNIKVSPAKQMSFEHLPSGELALYILTINPEEYLITYVKEGVSGFVRKAKSQNVKINTKFTAFNLLENSGSKGRHFVLGQTETEFNLLEGVFI